MIVRDPWTTETYATGLSPVMLGALEASQPTSVKLADGTTYMIEGGEWGSYKWVRQAALIRTAYKQLGDTLNESKWAQEWEKRSTIWNLLQSGQDKIAVAKQFGVDLLLAPLRIGYDAGNIVVKTVNWLPLLGIAAFVLLLREGRRYVRA